MSDDEYDDDELDLVVDFEKLSASKEEIKNRVDQYLRTSKLGRMAFVAGDIQLAKDRFNLAMSLEMQTEFENNVDFGVTGGLLRDEMLTRCGSGIKGSVNVKYGNILPRLLQVFEHADAMVVRRPKDHRWYLIMAACLCLVNEWNKAEVVYKEGLRACPGNKELLNSMHSLHQVSETITDQMIKAGVELPPSWNSDEFVGDSIDTNISSIVNGVGSSSNSLEPNLRPVYKVDQRRNKSLPGSLIKRSSGPVLTISSSPSRGFGSNSLSQVVKRSRSKSVAAGNKHITASKRFSHTQKWNEHAIWKVSFSVALQAEKIDQGFSSRTLQTMRTINGLSDIELDIS